MGLPIGKLLSSVGGLILPPLGKLGKGKATKTGVGLVVGATAVQAGLPELGDIQALVDSLIVLVQAIGTAIALFGYGRKAGATLK